MPSRASSPLAFGNQARGRGLDRLLQPLGERLLVEARRDRVEHLDHDRAGIAQERAARPEQAGIERDRQAGRAGLAVEMRDAVFVARLGAGRAARALREDDDLATARRAPRAHARSCRRAPARRLPRSTGIMPAFQAYQPKNGIHISSRLRMKAGSCEQRQQRECLPQRLVLGGDEQRPRRNFLAAREFDLDAADHAQQPEVGAPPERRDRKDRAARHHQRRHRRR